MTAEATLHTAGAASHAPLKWHTLDLAAAHQNVRRLQARIVKAQQAGKTGKVKALQRLLTHWFSGKVLAVKRVTENQGKRTAGVDKQTWETPQKKAQAVEILKARGYQPLPLRRIYIPKSNGKLCPLSIPTMQDRAMQALYLLALDPVNETTADPNSYGFRQERSPADAIGQCFTVLAHHHGPEYILEGDIRACFDKISHSWVEAHVPIDQGILHKWLKAGYIEKCVLKPTEEGCPQGGICSPAIANCTLDGLEALLRECYPRSSTKGRKAKVNFIRFADDFIITGNTKMLLENEVKPLVEAFMRERGLELSPEKTRISHIEDGFDFLGQNIRSYRGKVLVKPAPKNVKAFLTKVRQVIKTNAQAKAGNLILQLNPKIRGWANYHRHINSKRTFIKVDCAIFQALWRWACRRHPQKSKHWIKAKYFKTVGNSNWVFSGEADKLKSQIQQVRLFKAASTPIRRHIKIKGAANPYDREWEIYFEERLGVKMVANLQGRRQLLHLWREQNGICPVCNQKITKLTGWHNHHIVWRSNGGQDKAANRVLLHPNCHRKVHSQKLEVAKPRPSK